MKGRYNRVKGHNYKRQITRELKKIFSDPVTSRSSARGEDISGIDIVNTGMFNIQTKAREHLNLFNVFNNEMPIVVECEPKIRMYNRLILTLYQNILI